MNALFRSRYALIALALSAALHAQTATPCVRNYTNWIGSTVLPHIRSGAEEPFTVTVKHSFEHKLSDGNTIRWSTEATESRDENGRTMEERILGCQLDNSGRPQLRVDFNVFDHKSQTTTHWSTGPGTTNEARTIHPHPIQSIPPSRVHITTPMASPMRTPRSNESLGSRTIAGIEASGSRYTETLSAEETGSETPIKIVHEHWMSVDQTHKTLMIVTDDPRTGRLTWEVTSITLGPPDPSLFTPPTDYTIVDESLPIPEPPKQ